MNRIEEIVYQAIKGNPALRQFVRDTYMACYDLLPRRKNTFSGVYDFREGAFFGFHDVSPFSDDDTKLLANRASFDMRMPAPSEPLEVGYFDLRDGKIGDFHKIGESFAWNWHKGCRLQWLDQDLVIFNTAADGRLCSCVASVSGKERTRIPYPVDTVYRNERECVATSFSYERLGRCMPGYGYPYADEGRVDEAHPEDTGLFLVDLNSGERKLLVSLDRLAKMLPEELHEGHLHFVTHTEFSPDGRYISFLYRRIPMDGNFLKRWTRILVYDRQNDKVMTLPTQDSGSHYVWNSRNQLIASCNIDRKQCHVLFDIERPEEFRIIAGDRINSDGHQSFISDTRFVTDTYPDKRRMARIYDVDSETGSVRELAQLYSPKKFTTKDFRCHIACDLHPRVSPSGKYICFDSPTSGRRGLYVMKLG